MSFSFTIIVVVVVVIKKKKFFYFIRSMVRVASGWATRRGAVRYDEFWVEQPGGDERGEERWMGWKKQRV
jgi:hypothetical protein